LRPLALATPISADMIRWSLKAVMKTFFFELCAETLEAAKAGSEGGADRIELCSHLELGGLTPSPALLNATMQAVSVPVFVLIRPRSGNFVYSDAEFTLMGAQIEEARRAGAVGVVIGVLLPNGHIDIERSRRLVKLARPMQVTFHRAFDETPDLFEALEDVVATGADCLLTSGGKAAVLHGADVIARLARQAGDRIEIMAGGGLRLKSLAEVARRSGVTSLHGSLLSHPCEPMSSLKTLSSDVRLVKEIMKECAQIALSRCSLSNTRNGGAGGLKTEDL